MTKFFVKYFWSFICILVASEQLELCSDKDLLLKEHLRQVECRDLENSRTRTAKAWLKPTLSQRTANLLTADERLKDLFKNAKDLNESHRKTTQVLNILQKVVISMRNHLNVTTIALFGATDAFNFKQVFIENTVPLLIIKDKVDWHIARQFNRHILSIVCLASYYSLEDAVFAALKQSLHGLHSNKIILIKDSAMGAQDNQLLNWFYSEDFWQVFLMDPQGNTLALQHLTGKLLNNLTLEAFMLRDINWRNLQGAVINCSMAWNPPRAIVQYDEHKNVILKGYYGSVIRHFAQHYNASLKAFLISANYTEIVCSYYISKEKLDICSNPLPYDENYLITYPEQLTKTYLMVPYDKPLDRFYYFLKPFQQNVWFVVTTSFVYKMVTLSFIHRLQHGTWNISLQILYAVVSVLYLPFQLTRVKPPLRRFLEIIMICVGFVVANWYLSILSSLLYTRLYSRDINSFQNLLDHNISIMVDEFGLYVLNHSEIDSIIRQQLKLVPDHILLQHRLNLDPHYAYCGEYDVVDFYLQQQKFLQRPRMKVLPPAVSVIAGGIPMRANWPFQHLFNHFHGRLVESGIFDRLYLDALEDGIRAGFLHYFHTEQHYVEPLSLQYFQMPFMLLGVGYLLAFTGFILEWLVFEKPFKKYF